MTELNPFDAAEFVPIERTREYLTQLDQAYRAIDALGGPNMTSIASKALDDALKAIEAIGGMDPAWRASRGVG